MRKKLLFRALSFQISSTALWSGSFHLLNLFRTLKSCKNINYPTSSFKDLLLKSDRCMMLISHQRTLCNEIFKAIKKVNPPFMQKIFKLWTLCYSLQNLNDLAHIRSNKATFGSFVIGPQTWNNLPNVLKSAESLEVFKRLIKIGMDLLANAVLVSACLFKIILKVKT